MDTVEVGETKICLMTDGIRCVEGRPNVLVGSDPKFCFVKMESSNDGELKRDKEFSGERIVSSLGYGTFDFSSIIEQVSVE